MYNGYNYYPSNGSSTAAPFILMPINHFDSIFMPFEPAENTELDNANQNLEVVSSISYFEQTSFT